MKTATLIGYAKFNYLHSRLKLQETSNSYRYPVSTKPYLVALGTSGTPREATERDSQMISMLGTKSAPKRQVRTDKEIDLS